MVQPSDVTPLILAAGASTRMGRPKALMDFDGKTCLDLALESIRGLGTPVVVLGADRDEIQARVPLGSVQIALNEDFERGETSSIKIGLACLAPAAAAFLLRPVDFPLVSAEEVSLVIGAFLRNEDPNKTVFVPAYGMRRGFPVLFQRELAGEFMALPDDAPPRAVMGGRTQRICHVECGRAYVLMDMDTPEDYRRCLEAYRARRRETGRRGS